MGDRRLSTKAKALNRSQYDRKNIKNKIKKEKRMDCNNTTGSFTIINILQSIQTKPYNRDG